MSSYAYQLRERRIGLVSVLLNFLFSLFFFNPVWLPQKACNFVFMAHCRHGRRTMYLALFNWQGLGYWLIFFLSRVTQLKHLPGVVILRPFPCSH